MIRPPGDGDVDAIVALVHACELHDAGPEHADAPESIHADLIASRHRRGFDRATDSWVAEREGEVVGYADVHLRPSGEAVTGGYVHPDRRGEGIGSRLLERVEARADGAATLTAIVSGTDHSGDELLADRGYRPGFRSWQMRIELEDPPPPPPPWPHGVAVRTLEHEGDARAVHVLIEAAYAEVPDRVPVSYDEWSAYMFREDTDPSLYFLAERGDDLVGVVLCPWYPDLGWIRQLAVSPAARREGLGLALLRHAFGALYARGHRGVGLGVDEWNAAALRLYERAGMRRVLEHRRYQRP